MIISRSWLLVLIDFCCQCGTFGANNRAVNIPDGSGADSGISDVSTTDHHLTTTTQCRPEARSRRTHALAERWLTSIFFTCLFPFNCQL
ncbi:hypothetical protein BDZ89DRAFT_709158 [Hymenopellis radicata]|nr:hypothetical protein BDZ89DRAFT_709158 [Hymenopellis radicata]